MNKRRHWRVLLLVIAMMAILTVFASASADEIGSERTLNCATSSWSGLSKEACVLAEKTAHADIYVMKDDRITADDTFLPSGTTPSANAKSFGEEFEKIYSMISVPGKNTYFGQPYTANTSGKVLIILMDVDRDNGAVGGFNAGRFVAKSSNPVAYDDIMVFMDISDTRGYRDFNTNPTTFYTTLIHEYTHMLNYSYYISTKGSMKALWLDEGIAELAGILYSKKTSFSMLGVSMFLPNYSMIPTDAQWRTAENQSDPSYSKAHYGVAGMMLLHYYESGSSISDLVADSRAVDSKQLVATHYKSANSFDGFFKNAMLSYYVDDPKGINPNISSFGVNTHSSMDTYYIRITEGTTVSFSRNVAPYMPSYFARQYENTTQVPPSANVLIVTMTDSTSYGSATPTDFYATFMTSGGGMEYYPLNRNGETKIPYVMGNNSLRFFSISYNTSNTAATLTYRFDVDDTLPKNGINPPTNLDATVSSNGTVKLTWTAPAVSAGKVPAKSYIIYKDGVQIGTSNYTNYSDSTYKKDKLVEYQVVAVNGDLVSEFSGTLYVGRKLNAPVISGAASGLKVSLTWAQPAYDTEHPKADSYEVFIDGKSQGKTTSLSYTSGTLKANTTYTFHVIAHSNDTKNLPSDPSNSITITVVVKVNPALRLRGTVEDRDVLLEWDAPSTADGALAPTGYEVYRDGTRITTVTGTIYRDKNLERNKTYSYYVVAYNGNIKAEPSNTISMLISPVNPPLSLTASLSETNDVVLSWKAPQTGEEPDKYDIYRDDVRIATVTGTSYTDTGTYAGLEYTYYVVSRKGDDVSGPSNSVTIKIPHDYSKSSGWAKKELSDADRLKLIPPGFPDDWTLNITREEFCELIIPLYTQMTGKEPPLVANPFTDTDNEAVIRCYGLGIVNGVGDGLFMPYNSIVRQEVATILYRTLQKARTYNDYTIYDYHPFDDMDQVAEWARIPVLYMAQHDIINGMGNNLFVPRGLTTREQAVALSLRIYLTFN